MKKPLESGMLLDAQKVLDTVIPTVNDLRHLVPPSLLEEFDRMLNIIEGRLADCDVAEDYRHMGEWVTPSEEDLETLKAKLAEIEKIFEKED